MAVSDPAEQGPRRGAARLRDVAEAAGVDPSIASRILSGDGALTVRPDTRRRVLEAASRLSYRPNNAARALKTRKTMAIGMIVPELQNVAYATIATGADERASRAGYALLVATGSVRDRLDAIDGRIDGLLVGIATSDTVRIGDLGGQVPTVLVNSGRFDLCPDNRRYTDFAGSRDGRPRTLTRDDLPRLAAGRYDFARKFEMARDPELLDRIDAQVLGL